MAIETSAPTLAPSAATRLAVRLSTLLGVAVCASALLTFVVDGLLVGPPVMNGSARGTALVMFLVGAPVLVASGRRVLDGSTRARFVWAGMSMFLTYNSFMLLTGTPINRLFLLYVATFGLTLATMIAIAFSTDVEATAARCERSMPARPIAAYLGIIFALNALAWLARIVPATVEDRMAGLVEGMGLSTVPTYLQDLSFWLPLLALGSWLLWHHRAWGYVISGAALVFWAVEAATVAADQWFGHRADPASVVASDVMVVPFAVLAVVGAAVLWSFLRHVDIHTAVPAR